MSFKIGNIEFGEYPVFLAPMENVTDPVFRWLCKDFEVDLMYTEFISADGIIHGGKKGLQKLILSDDERPVAIQLYGKNIDSLVEAAKIAEQSNPEIIDLNFGCPVKKIANKGAGSGLLRDLPLLLEITEKVVKAVKTPVTVKTRLGWDSQDIVIEDLAERLLGTGMQALTLHGRTKAQLYGGRANWEYTGRLTANPKLTYPIIGNGDINTAEDAKYVFDTYNPDAIMIGRSSIGRPWIFREIKHYLRTGEILPEPTVKEKVRIARYHFEKSLELKPFRAAIVQMRRHYVNYFKGIPDIKPLRLKILTANTAEEVHKALDEIDYNFADIVTEAQVNFLKPDNQLTVNDNNE